MRIPPCLAVVALASATVAQNSLPRLTVQVPVTVDPVRGGQLLYALDGLPNAVFALLADGASGPVVVLGERFALGFTPALTTAAAGRLPSFGHIVGTLPVPADPALQGRPFWFQAAVVNASARNGLFEASNAESTVIVTGGALVDRFTDPAAQGFTGNYDRRSQDQLRGGAVRVRTHRTVDPQGIPFGLPLATPFHATGARTQMVFRPRDLGSQGEEEIVTAIRWRPFSGTLVADRIERLDLDVVHSLVMPDYTIDPFSALPAFPNSGLDELFAANPKPGERPVRVRSGAYAIGPQDLRPDGYVDYRLRSEFHYNGVDSLLLDFRVANSRPSAPRNGQIVRQMVLSSARPNGRVAALAVDPDTATRGQGDNTMYDYQFEFVRVKTSAVSPWRDSGLTSPDWQTPTLATIEPRGTSVAIEFRGGDDAQGNNATSWSSDVDVADGKRFLQYRVTLVANRTTGAVPEVDTLVVTVQ